MLLWRLLCLLWVGRWQEEQEEPLGEGEGRSLLMPWLVVGVKAGLRKGMEGKEAAARMSPGL